MRRSGFVLLYVLATLPVSALRSTAEDVGELFRKVELYGYGTWSYGKTDGNNYLGGTEDGAYDRVSLTLATSARMTEKLRVVGQFMVSEGGGDMEGVELDYAFGEWKFSDAFKLKAGKVRQPFGAYTEVRDVGTLRPFIDLAQAVYGPIGLTSIAYEGIGFSGIVRLNPDWELEYDMYFGGITSKEFEAPEDALVGEEGNEEAGMGEQGGVEIEKSTDALGGRLRLVTPIPGLVFGFSAITGKESSKELGKERRNVYGAEAQYLSNRVWLTTEYVHEKVENGADVTGWYVEAAFKPLDDHLQLAALISGLDFELPGTDTSTSVRRSLTQHDEWAVGVNYWFSPNFVLKLSFHDVDGNRISIPDATLLDEQVENGTLQTRTRLVLFGAQFSF